MNLHAPVNARKIALLERLGYDPSLVPVDEFDEQGFSLIGAHEGLGALIMNQSELLRTRIPWPDMETSRAAVEAMRGDFDEMVGPEAAAQLGMLRATDTPDSDV